MPIQLGGGYRTPVVPVVEDGPVAPTVESLQSEQVLSALAGLREALANMPAPIIQVDQPDLTAIVNAVTQLNGPASAGEIAQAVKLAIAPQDSGPDPVMSELVDALKTLDFRLKGVGSGSAAGSSIGSYLLSTAPASDTGQSALPVRVISQLGAGAGGASPTSVTINDPTTVSQKLAIDASGRVTVVQSGPVAVTGAFFPATQPVSGTVTVANPTATGLTDTQLRATPVPVSGTVATGGLTDTQLRATAVPISGTVSTGLAQPLTDTQLRATAVPVSGTVAVSNQPAAGLTDTQLRATAVPVSAAAMTDGTQKSRITNGTTDTGIEPFGALQVNNGFQTLFYDSWSTSPIDTVDKWTVTGTAPTIAGGNMQMSATAATFNAIRTKDVVRPNVGFSLVRNGISIETATATGAGRFWGLGTPATTPLPASLAQDGIGFELDQMLGTLLAVTYVGGTRTTIATLTRPTDGVTHGYGIYFRVTQAYWLIDGVQVAAQSFPNVQMVELPALIVRQNGAAFTGTPSFVNIAHLTADTSRQSAAISDPVIGTRMARVGADGTLKVSGMGVAGTPNAGVQTVQGAAGGTALPVSGAFFQATQPVSLATNTPDVTDRAARLLGVLSAGANQIGSVVNATGTNTIGHLNELRAATLAVTVTSTAGAAATLTLPAPAAGLFHYITSLELTLYSSAARTGAAAPIVVTTTNVPGALAYTFDTAGAIGTNVSQRPIMTSPLRSSAAATATTFVAPIATGGTWRLSATYFTAA